MISMPASLAARSAAMSRRYLKIRIGQRAVNVQGEQSDGMAIHWVPSYRLRLKE